MNVAAGTRRLSKAKRAEEMLPTAVPLRNLPALPDEVQQQLLFGQAVDRSCPGTEIAQLSRLGQHGATRAYHALLHLTPA